MLDKYLTPDKVESVKEIFTGLYSLGKVNNWKIIKAYSYYVLYLSY